MKSPFKTLFLIFSVLLVSASVFGQISQVQTQLKVKQLIDKKAEYNRLTNSETDGYRIKIHFGGDRQEAKNVRNKFSAKFTDYRIDEEYQQPNFVVLIGDFKTKLEAFESLKKIQGEFPNSFIVKGRIREK
ncbi:MAG: SPOR domain-containing protein [Bacteroidetes bacterium]|nr:SPOR domain-containing protein [Bacteroidota bacterium]